MSDIWQRLRKQGVIDAALRQEVEQVFGRKGKTALDAVTGGRVKKYLDFFVVEGRTASYIVEDDFCSCSDFLFRGRACWHLLAVRIARETGRFETVNRWYLETLRERGS